MLTPEEVRQMSIKLPNKDFKHPQSWLPPVSVLKTLTKLIQCQIDYLLTCWNHEALMPAFLSYGCITRTDAGDLIYTMGPDMHTDDKITLLHLSDEDLAAAIRRSKIVRKKSIRKQEKRFGKGIPQTQAETYGGPEDSAPEVAQQAKFQIDTMRMKNDEDIANLPLADMSLDDIPTGLESPYEHVAEKRPINETRRKSVMSEQLPRMSTPK